MKKRLLPLSVASLLAFLQPAMTQENPSPSPSPEASPTATPAASATPEATASPSPDTTPAAADSSSSASTASPEEIAAAAEKTGTPAASPSPSASPAAAAATPDASPTANAAPVDDADFLPEPTDANLGAPIDEPLPVGEVATDELPDPDALIPDGISDAADLPPPPAPVAMENKFEKERKLRVRYQEVKLQALKDPAVRSFNDQAERAKTDEAKRQALREYYRTLFAKMTAIDAELKPKCDTMQQAYLRRLGQYRVAPAIPLNPPPTPEPLAN